MTDWRQTRRQCVFGLSLPSSLHRHAFYERIVRGIQSVAHEEQVELLFFHENSTIPWEKVDGVILTTLSRAIYENLPVGMPAVSTLHALRSGLSVVTNDRESIQTLVEHLVSLGHRRIAYLTGGLLVFWEEDLFLPNTAGSGRMEGYLGALRAAGIEPLPAWVRPFRDPSEPMKPFEVLGREAMAKWLREDWRELGCTAILAQNDEAAVGIIEELQRAGYRVPDDVSVVGFDGLDVASYFRPRLTTIEVPLEEIGAHAARMLLEKIRVPLSALHVSKATAGPHQVTLPAGLKVGSSSGPCPAP